jgi:hypothetical protein
MSDQDEHGRKLSSAIGNPSKQKQQRFDGIGPENQRIYRVM